MSQPFVQAAKDRGRLCEMEVRLPSQQVSPQIDYNLGQTASTVTSRQLPYTLLEANNGLSGNCQGNCRLGE
jgi:hypothetical protein